MTAPAARATPAPRRVWASSGARLALALEHGEFENRAARALGRLWALRSSVARPVRLPRGVAVIGVGGATLGGSYKTPLVLALARALARRGERVAVVSHGYGAARLQEPRCVGPHETADTAGDEAIWLARELASDLVPVVVGGSRDNALCFAASLAPRIIVDALLQTSPERLALSVLTVDSARPWGAGRCPPAGDLRAPPASLVAAADLVVRVSPAEADAGAATDACGGAPGGCIFSRGPAAPARARRIESLEGHGLPMFEVTAELVGATPHSRHSRYTLHEPQHRARVSLSSFAEGRLRVGVVLAVASPGRVLASLAAHGIASVDTRLFRDHAAPHERAARFAAPVPVDVWLTTPKCATKLGPVFEGKPLFALDQQLTLPAGLVRAAAECTAPGR